MVFQKPVSENKHNLYLIYCSIDKIFSYSYLIYQIFIEISNTGMLSMIQYKIKEQYLYLLWDKIIT